MNEPAAPAAVAIVGAGPKGLGVLERICAGAPELLGDRRLVVHLIDPYPPGPGRVWRHDQSPLLLMNSKAADVTMFTDDSVQCEGPPVPGPTLAEWIQQVRDGTLTAEIDPGLRDELHRATPATFHTRRMQSAYLSWCYRRILDTRTDSVEVSVHTTEAVDLTESGDGDQLVWLRDERQPVRVDAVVLTVGHLDGETDAAGRSLADFARRHHRKYFPPGYTADTDLSPIEPGESVLVRGFGLAFIDMLTLLTEGRGGRYETGAGDELVYRPSGAEPILFIGSRRGVPYRPKPAYGLLGAAAELPRFFGPAEIAALAARPAPIRFRLDLWPLIAKELGWGYYTELFTAHPERVRMEFTEFAERYSELDWDTAEMRTLVTKAVPAAEDRFDPIELDRPLAAVTATDSHEMAARVRDHIVQVLDRGGDSTFSADLGAVTAMLSVFRQLPAAVATGKLDPASQLFDVDGWWFGFFSYIGSGPPRARLEELLALERAGIVSFVGPEMWVATDEERGLFLGGSRKAPGTVASTTLVDARLPSPDVSRTTNPIVRALHDRGRLGAERLVGESSIHSTGRIHTSGIDGQLFDADGVAHPRRFALGPHTSLRIAGAFSRPRTNALGFRENDSVARQVLRLVGADRPRRQPRPQEIP
ncbi:adenylate cyclase [Nocardia nova]|uniref:Adenylate cyclase n=1 Tax=Nocardia nova TaxID=37330 RepID=A0A2S6AJK9_9NOCA|nr:FAD/NAD(P)-binding protein [Nocardia nova]PPJ25426.1 adenylate cyclase [Nocardia nova]PPJ35408.1 adenylate cyclase [Nocardia nova]